MKGVNKGFIVVKTSSIGNEGVACERLETVSERSHISESFLYECSTDVPWKGSGMTLMRHHQTYYEK